MRWPAEHREIKIPTEPHEAYPHKYDGRCDALVSLHACGGASDAALQLAARRDAPFAVSPCCVGALPVGVAPGGKHGTSARGASVKLCCERARQSGGSGR